MGLFLLMLIDNAYYRAVDMQWLIAIGCGQLPEVMGTYQRLWLIARGCGQLPEVMGNYQRLWLIAIGCG